MAGTLGEETIVEGNEETGVTGDRVGGGEGEGEGEEEETKEKVDRLRGLLEDNPKKMGNKDVEDVIRCLNVDEIISLALKSVKGKESEECWVAEEEDLTDEEEGDCEKEAAIARSMLCCVWFVRSADIRLIYEKWSPKAFATLLLAALDSNSIRQARGGLPVVKAEDRDITDMIPKLCCVLPWKLLAHVLNAKKLDLLLDNEADEEQEEPSNNVQLCFDGGRADPTRSPNSF